jgi:hypothetical protein
VPEQIYAIVADGVRRRFASNRSTGIPQPDSTLALLLWEADRFDVLSAGPVADRLGVHDHPRASTVDPNEFDLGLNGDYFALASVQGRWRIQFPWYFMLRSADRVTNGGEPPADVVSLSTLTAANSEVPGGGSQPSILIVAVQNDSLGSFWERWHATFGVYSVDSTAKAVPQAYRTYQRKDPARHMRAEANLFKTVSGWMIVGYFGAEGAFQADRQQYLDLVGTLQTQ